MQNVINYGNGIVSTSTTLSVQEIYVLAKQKSELEKVIKAINGERFFKDKEELTNIVEKQIGFINRIIGDIPSEADVEVELFSYKKEDKPESTL